MSFLLPTGTYHTPTQPEIPDDWVDLEIELGLTGKSIVSRDNPPPLASAISRTQQIAGEALLAPLRNSSAKDEPQ